MFEVPTQSVIAALDPLPPVAVSAVPDADAAIPVRDTWQAVGSFSEVPFDHLEDLSWGRGAPAGLPYESPRWAWLWFSRNDHLRRHRVPFSWRRPTHHVAAILGGLLAVLLIAGIAAGLIQIIDAVAAGPGTATPPLPELSEAAVYLNLMIVLVTFTLIPILWTGVFHGGVDALAHRLGLRTERPVFDIAVGLGIGIIMVPVAIIMVLAYYLMFPAPAGAADAPAATMAPTWGLVFMISFAAGVSEEVLFRGWLQPRFGVFTSNALFALSHINYGTMPQLVVPFLLGFGFSAMTTWRRSLLPAIVAHITFDVVMLSLAKVVGGSGGAAWGATWRDLASVVVPGLV